MAFASQFRFCPHCAAELHEFGDDQVQRRRCGKCGWIQYRNPTVGVAVVLISDGQILIGKRRDGGLCIPCGHVEWNESVETAAKREFQEETGLLVELQGVVAVKSNFHDIERQTIGIWYRGEQLGGDLRAGGDLLDVGFCDLESIPKLKFPTDNEVIGMLRTQLT